MHWPTVKQAVGTIAGLVTILSVLGGAAWSYDRHVVQERITELIAKREAEGLTPRERARLENMLREWERVCTGDSS